MALKTQCFRRRDFQTCLSFSCTCLDSYVWDLLYCSLLEKWIELLKLLMQSPPFNAEDHSRKESYRYIAIKKRHVPVVLKLAIV